TYLVSWYADQQKPIPDIEIAYRQILSDVLNKDMSTTSESVIPDDFGQAAVQTFPPGPLQQQGVVLQIQDTNDITNSTFSLLNSLQNLTTVRQTYVERQVGQEVTFPRGMLRWTLTDGTRQIQAMEMETIPELDLKTPFGCKLLIKNCQVRRGMLLLYKNSIKVLGGDVPSLYGGDMVAELERRFKAELGIEQQTAQPPSTSMHRSSTASTLLNSSNSDTLPRPPNRFESFTQNTIGPIDEFDDFEDDDMLYSAVDEMTTRPVDLDLPDSSIPQPSLTSDPISTLSDDDDFVEPSFSPMRVDATRSSPSSGSSISLSKSKKSMAGSSTTPPRQEPSAKRSRYDTMYHDSLITHQADAAEQDQEGDDDGMDLSDLGWVNTSVWENLNNVKREGVRIDEEGRMHCTFDVIARKLKAMERDEPSEDLADIVFIKAKCVYFTNLRLSQTQKFNLEIEIADPDNTSSETFNVILNDHVLSELMGTSKQALLELSKQKGGQKRIMKEVFQPFQRKVMSATAILQLDISVMETKASQKDPGKTIFLPVVVGYEKYT
ncbi:RecQ-mediated genome instability protein 1, partial [Choanephora cucurbitarum]